MTLSKIWVLAEATDGKVTTTTLELLTKARELADTVEAVYAGADADAIAAELGEYGATKVLRHRRPRRRPPRRPRGRRPSPPRSRAAPPPTPSSPPPATTVVTSPGACRPSSTARVLTNNVDLEVDGDKLVTTEPVFGGITNVKTTFTAGGPHIVLIRPKSFAAEPAGGGAAAVETIAVPDVGRQRRGHHREPPRRGARRARRSTRPPSSCPAAVASASPRSTPWSRSWPSC